MATRKVEIKKTVHIDYTATTNIEVIWDTGARSVLEVMTWRLADLVAGLRKSGNTVSILR